MIFDHPEFDDHEQVAFVRDSASGLRAVIAIHLVRGRTAGGGVRFRPYPTDDAALTDVLRLSAAMTYKMALAGMTVGGAKSVIIGDPRRDKTPELLAAFGRAVDRLGGRYTCGPDVGTDGSDMDQIAQVTSHVAGRDSGAGSTAPPTALGVFHGLEATARAAFGRSESIAADAAYPTTDLSGLTVAVQGVGGVGGHLVDHLVAAGATVSVADVDQGAVAAVRARHPQVTVVDPSEILFADVDLISPNAVGGVLDAQSVPRIRARAICGSANNQLAHPEIGELLATRGITWAPDYVVSSGGAIAGVCEIGGITPAERDAKIASIGTTTFAILEEARTTGESAEVVARRHGRALLGLSL